MFFSILIPVYNVDRYIRKCVDSVLSQEEQDFEIILCDDGSTDQSGAICDEYVRKYRNKVRVIHKQNEGLLLTRRRAIKEARGEWFIHLDSDDYMMPNALSTIKETILHYDPDLIIYSFIIGNKDENDLSHRPVFSLPDFDMFEEDKELLYKQFFCDGNINNIWQKAARREIVDIDDDYSSKKEVSLMEDYLQSLPLLLKSNKTIFVNAPLVYYRYNEKSITRTRGFSIYHKGLVSKYTVYKAEEQYRKKMNISSDLLAKIYAKHIRQICLFVGALSIVADKEEWIQFKKIIDKLSVDDWFLKELSLSDRNSLGKVSFWCSKLIINKKYFLIRVLYLLLNKKTVWNK